MQTVCGRKGVFARNITIHNHIGLLGKTHEISMVIFNRCISHYHRVNHPTWGSKRRQFITVHHQPWQKTARYGKVCRFKLSKTVVSHQTYRSLWSNMVDKFTTIAGWWFGTCFFFSIQLGMSSSELTNSSFVQRGRYTSPRVRLIEKIQQVYWFRGFTVEMQVLLK